MWLKIGKIVRIIATLCLMAFMVFADITLIGEIIGGASLWLIALIILCTIIFGGCTAMLIGIFKNWEKYWYER